MTAQDQMRAMLDQLMGTARDGEVAKTSIRFDSSRVCKSFLLNCCPHDLLASTRCDLGDCPKIHDVALRADFEVASKTKDYYYDIDAMEHLESFLTDCDIKMEQAKRRLKETQEELSEEAAAKINTIHAFGEQIGTKLAKAEEVGAQGDVEESLRLLEEVEELKKQKMAAEMDYHNTMPASNYQQQKLRVCEVCSAFLGIHDNDRRLADHFGGKLHVGFIILRAKLAELKESIEERKKQRQKEREDRRMELDRRTSPRTADRKSTSIDRGGRNSVERKRSRSSDRRRRSRSSDRRRRSRSSDRRRRSRSSGRRRRSRSSDRKRRSRSSDRKRRSRSSDRKRRSRSPDRKRRSRSRDRHTSRSRRSRSKRSRSRDRRKRSKSRSRSRKNSSRRSRSRSGRSHNSSRHHSRSESRRKDNGYKPSEHDQSVDGDSKKSDSNSHEMPNTTAENQETQY